MQKGIDSIIKSIANKVNELKNGELNVQELDALTNDSRELYEMLVVMRYQKAAHSEIGKETIENQEPEKEVVELMEKTTEPSGLMFDLEEKEVEIVEDVSIFEPITEPATEAVPEKTPLSEPEQKKQEEKVILEDDTSINNNYQDKFSSSIADKMQLIPIGNLTGHISLNQRFIFISNLFGNNAEAYNSSIAFIDRLENSAQAKEKLNELHQEYSWDLENNNVIEFVTLVERRFI